MLIDDVFDHYSALYYVLVVGTLAYAASYFARGWLAGHEYFALFGGLVLMESLSRLCFALAVALGIAHGQTAVVLGIAAAPFVSLVVVPAAFARACGEPRRAGTEHRRSRRSWTRRSGRGPGTEGVEEAVAADELSLRRGSGFAFAVSGVMLSEQTLLNAAVSDRRHHLDQRGAGGDRVQRAADRAGAAAAVPGDPDFAAPPPNGPRGDRGARGVREGDPV